MHLGTQSNNNLSDKVQEIINIAHKISAAFYLFKCPRDFSVFTATEVEINMLPPSMIP